MNSRDYTVEAPMSYAGSARRLWRGNDGLLWRLLALLFFIPFMWTAVTLWYLTFGLLVVPYRLIRRDQRKRKLADLRHREVIEAVNES
jgi:hypothetical protein